MAGPCDHGGIHMDIPDGGDAHRDMLALIRATLRGDELGQDVILANSDLGNLVRILMGTLTGCLIAVAIGGETDPDAPPSALTEEQIQAVEAFLEAAISGPGDHLDADGTWS